MLIDVKRDKKIAHRPKDEAEMRKLLGEIGGWKLYRIQRGFYITGANLHMILENSIKYEWPELEGINCYGVCDSPDQFIERYDVILESDNRRLFVTFLRIEKRKQPMRGGWRWHKWGPYIGEKNPQHEYI